MIAQNSVNGYYVTPSWRRMWTTAMPFSPGCPSPSLTRASASAYFPSAEIFTSMTAVRPICYMPSCACLMLLSECRATLHRSAAESSACSAWRNTSATSPTLPIDSIYGLPAATGCSCRPPPTFDVLPSDLLCSWSDGLKLAPRQLLKIRYVPLMVYGAIWKLFSVY